MADTTESIVSYEVFNDRLADLFGAAEGGLDVERAYDVETTRDGGNYDVMVSVVVPNRG